MLSSLLAGFDSTQIAYILLRIPCVLLAISFHESAHGWVAEKLGDPTARVSGRISMNPMRHFDIAGTVCMVLFGFGWATPVPINPRNFKNPKRGMAISALAGPVSNCILMLAGLLLYRILWKLFLAAGLIVEASGSFYYGVSSSFGQNMIQYSLMLLNVFALLNASLAVFNFIPVPPLDGSRILLSVLPEKAYFGLMRYERYIVIALMVALFTGLLDTPLSFLVGLLEDGGNALLDLLPFLKI